MRIENFQDLNFKELLLSKVQAIEHLIQESKSLHNQIESCITQYSSNVLNLNQLISGEMDFSLGKIENFFRQKYGKEYFCLSFEHKGLALDLSKILEFVMEKKQRYSWRNRIGFSGRIHQTNSGN